MVEENASTGRVTCPGLTEPYASALREAVAYLFERFAPTGIVAAGSILRGEGGPGSDLDIYVLHDAPFRQRVQRRFNGVPCELFVNPPRQVERYFADERRRGHPSTAHMLATGIIIHDLDGTVERLRVEALAMLDAGPEPSEAFLLVERYGLADTFENATDIVETDPEMCVALLARAVDGAIAYYFWQERCWQPPVKHTLRALDELNPDLAALTRRFHREPTITRRVALACEIIERTSGETGFFEWESSADPGLS